MSKELVDIPLEVANSAWLTSSKWYVKPIKWLHDKLYWIVGFPIYLAWWVPAYWLLIGNLPFEWAVDSIPLVRNFVCWSYLVFFLLTLCYHWFSLQMAVPRADKSFPLVCDDESERELFRHLSYHVLGFAALLFIASAMKSHGSAGYLTHLVPAVLMALVGGGALLFSLRPPTYGFRVPTESQVRAARAAINTRLLTPHSALDDDYATPITKRVPTLKFDDIFGMQAVKDKLLEPAQRALAARTPGGEPPANGILLHGEPGNGKTIFAEALAGELGVPFAELTYGAVSSKWLGEMPRVISNCFTYARRNAPCVFFIDEIDSFIRSRDAYSNNSEDQKITNTLLTEIVSLRKHQVVLVGATNFLASLDTAAIREGRFDYKVEITPPDEPARVGLLSHGIRRHAPHLAVNEAEMNSVAQRWGGFSASRLMAVVKAMPQYAQDNSVGCIRFADWMSVLRSIQGRKGHVPKNAKPLRELILQPNTREALELIAGRLADAARIEALGGTLPTGILFHGASGTGKTAAARAIAAESNWAFLAVAGPDLLHDRERLVKIYSEAMDLRPALIFVDEADDVLRDRRFSNSPDLVNRLLALMDGVERKVKDVVFIAATNHPEQIDPALLRAGRFTEKIEFTLPPREALRGAVAQWLSAKALTLEADLEVSMIADMLLGQTIASTEGVLQYALNRAIARDAHGQTICLSVEDVEIGIQVVATKSGTRD